MKNGNEVSIETLEKVSNALIVPINNPQPAQTSSELGEAETLPQNQSLGTTTTDKSTSTTSRSSQTKLKEHTSAHRMGQTGVSY